MNQESSNSDDFYGPMLRESIDRYFAEYRKGVTDFSSFTFIFSRLLQNVHDPPLEIAWFYSALSFHTAKFAAQEPSEALLVTKDLFHMIVSCTASCCALKRIAALAPVVYVLLNLVTEMKMMKKVVENLIDGIGSYISLCCGSESDEDNRFIGMGSCFMDSARVWMLDKFGEDLRAFFPLVSGEIYKRIGANREVGNLAGIVMTETILLMLCLKFEYGMSRMQLQKDIPNIWFSELLLF